MGKPSTTAADQARAFATGTLDAPDAAGAWVEMREAFNVAVWGTFTATVALEASFDGGTTAIPWGMPASYGMPLQVSGAFATWLITPERGCLFRWKVTAHTDGTVNWRISQ